MGVDSVYLNAKVVTVDRDFSIAEAFAVDGDRFVAIGGSKEITRIADATTKIVDLGGRTVLPGFVDTHAHTVYRGLGAAAKPSLAGVASVTEIAARIGAAVATSEPGAWIAASPIGDPPDFFDLPERLAERRWPTRADLDVAAPGNPVCIPTSAYWPHPSVFNSTALSLLGITRDTPDEPGVRIIKDAGGEPTGVVYGLIFYNWKSTLYRKLMSMLPRMPEEIRRDTIALALRENLAVGITSIYEGHGNSFTADLRALHEAGRLAGRVVGAYEVPVGQSISHVDGWMAGLTDAIGQGTGDDVLKVVGATVSLDGPVHFGQALMSEPYLDQHGELGNGSSPLSTEELVEIARLAVKHDLRLNILAAGDRAAAMVVDALEAVDRETPLVGRQWVVQHFFHPTKEQITKLKAMGFVVQTYSSLDFSRGEEIYVERLPGDLWERVTPLRWWFDAGVPVAQASDGGHYDPMFQIWASLRRVDGRTGRSLLTPPKTVSRAEAIQTYTINGAAVLQWADRIGSIEVGKLADFVVLDKDILTCGVDEIRETTVLSTVLGGQVVHGPASLA